MAAVAAQKMLLRVMGVQVVVTVLDKLVEMAILRPQPHLKETMVAMVAP